MFARPLAAAGAICAGLVLPISVAAFADEPPPASREPAAPPAACAGTVAAPEPAEPVAMPTAGGATSAKIKHVADVAIARHRPAHRQPRPARPPAARYPRCRPHGPYDPHMPRGYGGQPYSPDQWRRYWDNRYDAWRRYDRLERAHRFNVRDVRQRRRKLLRQHEQTLSAGLARLKAGDTSRAIAALRLAGELNQGDPACRIHLAQARLERGQYGKAAEALRAALRLQPRLAYADLHLDRYYARSGTLAAATEKLRAYLRVNPAPPDYYFLLGFLEYQRGHLEAAHAAFRHVAAAWPRDALTRTCLDLTSPAGP